MITVMQGGRIFATHEDWQTIDFTLYPQAEEIRFADGRVLTNPAIDPEAAANQHADAVDAVIHPAQLRKFLLPQITAIADEATDDFASLFPAWRVGEAVNVDDRRQYQGVVWRVIQAHTTQTDWPPDHVPALWQRATAPGEILPWVQPQGAHDAYQLGDKVTHNGQTWESTADNNVWEPGVYGWVTI